MRILVAEPLAREGIEILRRNHDVDEKVGLTPEEYRAILPEYDALVVRSQVKVDAEMIAAGARLLVIGRAGVGVDNVDLDAATRAGITVVNAPTGNTIAAAELTLALLFALARKVAAADASMRRGEWKRSAFAGHELRGKTLGIVGLGKIGQAIADRAHALEMSVIGSDPFVSAEQAARHGVEMVPFEELLARSDATRMDDAAALRRSQPGKGPAQIVVGDPGGAQVRAQQAGEPSAEVRRRHRAQMPQKPDGSRESDERNQSRHTPDPGSDRRRHVAPCAPRQPMRQHQVAPPAGPPTCLVMGYQLYSSHRAGDTRACSNPGWSAPFWRPPRWVAWHGRNPPLRSRPSPRLSS